MIDKDFTSKLAAGMRRGQKRIIYPEALDGSDDSILVLDTRSSDEYATSHIPGAVSIPDEEVRQRIHELPRDKRIAIVCQIGVKANNIQRLLELQGYEAYTVMGGYTAWMMAMDRLPVPGKSNNTATAKAATPETTDRRARQERRTESERRSFAGTGPDGTERRSGNERRLYTERRHPWAGVELDVRGLCCPGPILKVRERINQLGTGQLLRVHASDPAFSDDLKSWAQRSNVRIVYMTTTPNVITAVCEKRR